MEGIRYETITKECEVVTTTNLGEAQMLIQDSFYLLSIGVCVCVCVCVCLCLCVCVCVCMWSLVAEWFAPGLLIERLGV